MVLIKLEIDAYNRIDMYVVDISGSFLIVDMYKEVNMVLWGRLSELMVKTDPSIYRNFSTIENGHMVLYVKLQKEMYGCLKRVLLFYEKLVSEPK